MTKELSRHAATAKAIRAELKKEFPDTSFRVRAQSFSMGDSVDIDWTDGPIPEAVKNIVDKYQYGHFDGMTDMYEYSNRNGDIPQVKYVMTQREMSGERKAQIKAAIEREYAVDLDDPKATHKIFWGYASDVIYREFSKPGTILFSPDLPAPDTVEIEAIR